MINGNCQLPANENALTHSPLTVSRFFHECCTVLAYIKEVLENEFQVAAELYAAVEGGSTGSCQHPTVKARKSHALADQLHHSMFTSR
jgi:hypothetical protein